MALDSEEAEQVKKKNEQYQEVKCGGCERWCSCICGYICVHVREGGDCRSLYASGKGYLVCVCVRGGWVCGWGRWMNG